jgi:uncharacterized protein YgbK (DUF1537 family)
VNRPRLALVADDTTGALDAAAPFAAAGARTTFLLDQGKGWPAGAEVVAWSTESRHLPPDVAASRARTVARSPAEIVFKKVDSTLRGAVVAEVLGALAGSGRRCALLCPAVPAQGRTFRAGEVMVRGVPLPRSAAARDLRAPPPAGALGSEFRALVPGLRLAAWPAGAPAPTAGDVILADAEDDADLDRIAEWCLGRASEVMPAGAAGLSAALSRALFGTPGGSPVRPAPGPWLAVLGSRADETARQVQAFEAAGGTVLRAPSGRLDHAAVQAAMAETGPRFLAVAAMAGDGPDRPEAVAARLGALAMEAGRALPLAGLMLSGGDTARAALGAFGADRLHLLGEPLPGIALSALDPRPGGLQVLTKSGGFGADRTLLDLASMVGASALSGGAGRGAEPRPRKPPPCAPHPP